MQYGLRWSKGYIFNSSYHHQQIGNINLSHCCHILSWLNVWGGCTIICCRFDTRIYSGKTGFCVFNSCAVSWCAQIKKIVHYGLMVVYGYLHIILPHYHHYADLNEGMELLKCLSDIFCLECLSKIRLFHSHRALCIQLTHFSYDGCENTSN